MPVASDFPGGPVSCTHRGLTRMVRGELRREIARCLRTGRAKRRPRNHGETRGAPLTWS
jgi:hypothetical protein